MSIETMSKMVAYKSQLNNLSIQKMSKATKALDLLNKVEGFAEEQRTAESTRVLNDLTRSNNIIEQLNKMDFDSLSAEERIAIDEGKRYELQKSAAMYLHPENPVAAALTPPTGDDGRKVRDQNLEYTQSLLADSGAPIDQQEYFRETSANNESLANGGELSGVTYESIAPMSESIVRESVPGFEAADVHTVPEDMDVKLKTFRSVALNYFKTEHEANADLDTIGRIDASVRSALDDMGVDVEGSPDIANAFIQSGMEAIVQYREGEGSTNLQNLEGLVALNLVNSRDLVNKLGFEAANMAPSALIDALQKSQGFRSLGVISEAALAQGDDADLLSSLAAEVKRINPLIDDDSISEIERKNIVKKNFLDVLGSRVEKANVPPSQKLQMIKMLEKIDGDVDRGRADPMIDSMLEHVYERFTEGYSTYKAEERRVANIAASSGNGVVRDVVSNKLIQTTTDFERVRSNASGNKNKAIAGFYAEQVQNVSHGAGFDLVRSVADNGQGILAFTEGNKQFYFGTIGDNAINVGLSRIMDGIVQNKPLEKVSPAFANPEARVSADQVLRNVAIVNARKTANSTSGSLMNGLFQKAGPNNPIDIAKIKLEKFGDYYVPESVGIMFEENPTIEMTDLKNASLTSKLGGKAVYGAVLHAMQTQAQGAATSYNSQLTNRAVQVYADAVPDASGSQQPLYRVAMTQENDDFENGLPELTDGLPSTITPELRDNLIKHREGLEIRIANLKVGLRGAEASATEDQRAMFSGTAAENTKKNYDVTLNRLSEMRDLLSEIENMPSENYSQYSVTSTGAGFDAPSRRVQESARRKRNELSNRLMVLKSDMNRASL